MDELRKKDSLGCVVTNSSGFDSKINQENDGTQTGREAVNVRFVRST